MDKAFPKAQVRSKIWLQDPEGRALFGQGRIDILRSVQEHGSLNAAAQSLGMSYRAAWNRVRTVEKRLGRPLLESKIGGKSGGGSTLTPFAVELISRFEALQEKVELMSECFFEEFFQDFFK